jgi:hydroxyacylglutathione hydrolase
MKYSSMPVAEFLRSLNGKHGLFKIEVIMIDIIPIPVLEDNYIWLLTDIERRTAVIVDPGVSLPVIDFLKKNTFTLAAILITHHHWDHTGGIAEIITHYRIPVIGPAQMKTSDVPIESAENNIRIKDFSLNFDIITLPGHTLDHIAYYSPGILFCGDTLFAAGCGRIFEGTAEQMYASLQKIIALPNDTNIYCAHEYTLNNLRFAEMLEPNNLHIKARFNKINELRKQNLPSLPTTLWEEKQTNPFLRCDSPELINQVENYAGQKLNLPIDIFTWVRKWKDQQSFIAFKSKK